MKIVCTDQFKHDLQKIKDNGVRERVLKVVQKLIDNPNISKPLKYDLVGLRSVRVSPFRIVYEIYRHFSIRKRNSKSMRNNRT